MFSWTINMWILRKVGTTVHRSECFHRFACSSNGEITYFIVSGSSDKMITIFFFFLLIAHHVRKTFDPELIKAMSWKSSVHALPRTQFLGAIQWPFSADEILYSCKHSHCLPSPQLSLSVDISVRISTELSSAAILLNSPPPPFYSLLFGQFNH